MFISREGAGKTVLPVPFGGSPHDRPLVCATQNHFENTP